MGSGSLSGQKTYELDKSYKYYYPSYPNIVLLQPNIALHRGAD
jgi:hypothetical protein